MSFTLHKTIKMPTAESALKGRSEELSVVNQHFLSGHPIKAPFPEDLASIVFAMGCFWGAERKFWLLEGVYTTAVGYIQGYTENPIYEEVCSGLTGHTEGVLVVYDPSLSKLDRLLGEFWENHDPTQGMRQGNDVGTQYRSGIYCSSPRQLAEAEMSRDRFQARLDMKGYGEITTELAIAKPFYYAETYHQQYLAKNPRGYCGLGGCGVTYD